MRHLFNSTAQIRRLKKTANRGTASVTWVPYGPRFACRLDLTFVRPGKDQPAPSEAGKAPDRQGVLFYLPGDAPLRASDRVRVLTGPHAPSTFEVRATPDPAQDYAQAHHIEVGVYEVAQQVATS